MTDRLLTDAEMERRLMVEIREAVRDIVDAAESPERAETLLRAWLQWKGLKAPAETQAPLIASVGRMWLTVRAARRSWARGGRGALQSIEEANKQDGS